MNKNLLLAVSCGLSVLSSIGVVVCLSRSSNVDESVSKTQYVEEMKVVDKRLLAELDGRLEAHNQHTGYIKDLHKRISKLEEQSGITSTSN